MARIILKLIRAYQLFTAPLLNQHCRFYPSCSEYTSLAVKKYGGVAGLWLAFKRILRCHPWNPGGVDLP